MIRRPRIFFFALFLTVMAGAGGPGPAAAQGKLRLTPEIKARLVALKPLRGSAIKSEALGGRPVLVTFFASWCPPCRVEFSHIADYLKARGAEAITVVAVNWIETLAGASPRRLKRMVDAIHPAIRVVKGTAQTGRDFGGVLSIPAAYIFDAAGREVFRLGGDRGPHGRHFLRRDQLARAIDGLK